MKSGTFASRVMCFVVACLLGASVCGGSLAQDRPVPPTHRSVDDNWVDLLSGELSKTELINSVGPQGPGGLETSHRLTDGVAWTLSESFIKIAPDDMSDTTTVVLLGRTEVFSGTPQTMLDPMNGAVGEITIDGNDFVYKLPDGTMARFDKVALGLNRTTVFGKARSVTYPTGEVLTFSYGTALNKIESSLGYALTGNDYGGGFDWLPAAANLTQGDCSATTCSGPTYTHQVNLGRVLQTTSSLPPGSGVITVTLTSPAGGAPRTYIVKPTPNAWSPARVTSVTDGVGTWTYSYSEAFDPYPNDKDGILTTTVTDPLGHKRVVTSRMSNHNILTDTIYPDNGPGKTTTFIYNADSTARGLGFLTRVIAPEGDAVALEYGAYMNVTARWRLPKGTPASADPNTVAGATVVRASYNIAAGSLCATRHICDKPDWIRDARGNQTDFTYDPVHGGVLTVTAPAPTSGAVRPQTRYTYGQFTAMYVRGGVMQAAAAPVWRVTQTSTCQTLASCAGTADEVVTTYAYESSNGANNVRLLSTTTRSGDSALVATTTYAYDARGDVISTDGPLAGSADTTRTYYDASRWKTGVIGPDPDGTGALLYRASRTTYAADGQVTSVETG
ncbi:hypothetical protein SAMN02799626_05151, partial [Caulobacter sp. UNC279MFTsu5.1]